VQIGEAGGGGLRRLGSALEGSALGGSVVGLDPPRLAPAARPHTTVKERAGIAPAHHLRWPRLQVHIADQSSGQALCSQLGAGLSRRQGVLPHHEASNPAHLGPHLQAAVARDTVSFAAS
jgi:hypothetical protein